MKTSIYSIFAAGALLMGAASCSDGWGPHAGTDGDKGTIDLTPRRAVPLLTSPVS